jgi:serpin B
MMLNERRTVRLVLGLFIGMAVVSISPMEAAERASCQVRSQPRSSPARKSNAGIKLRLVRNRGCCPQTRPTRRSHRTARRGVTWDYCPQVQGENAVVATGASKPPKQENGIGAGNRVEITADVQAIARSNNQFAVELFRHLHNQNGNTFFSPASISTALAMIYCGAEGATRQQIAAVLHFELPGPQLHAGFGALNTILNTESKSYRLSVANRLWRQKGFHFEAPFLRSILKHYGAEPGEVDFAATEQARQAINQWVAEKTNGKIGDLIAPGALPDKTRLVLTNAIYFKGTWKYRFSKTDTHDAPFHVSKDRLSKVPTMEQTGGLRYAAVNDVQMLELPYAGGHLSMMVLLPKRVDGLPELEQKLSADDVQKWISALGYQDEVEVYLPKFTFASQTSLKDVLSSMGMPLAFNDQADFSGMSTEKEQKLFDAIHQAFVDVNEEGTEAAAATGGHGGDLPGPVPVRVVFRADHPFLFLIQDNRTGTILFLGRVVDPNR